MPPTLGGDDAERARLTSRGRAHLRARRPAGRICCRAPTARDLQPAPERAILAAAAARAIPLPGIRRLRGSTTRSAVERGPSGSFGCARGSASTRPANIRGDRRADSCHAENTIGSACSTGRRASVRIANRSTGASDSAATSADANREALRIRRRERPPSVRVTPSTRSLRPENLLDELSRTQK
jgi:hypothetical protein